jgi:uncharacterized membrane protein YkvI
MRKIGVILQICFTYTGTVVGAGFATGQEILQFFTKYGWMATFTIGVASFLFVWLGIKMMLLAHDVGAKSYEDMNRILFGPKVGRWVSLFTLFVLFGVATVMLAGGGSVFSEQLNISYQIGLLFTLLLAFLVLMRGMKAILAINSIVVPMMLFFSIVLVLYTWNKPGSENWLQLKTNYSAFHVWFAPLLYSAFNLAMAQAVLVPLGGKIKDRSTLLWGGVLGGVGIGLMLLAGHFALAAQMPGIVQYEIPMGTIISKLGGSLQILFIFVIYGEIFTTFIADIYGLSLQIEQRFSVPYRLAIPIVLLLSYAVSQIGFKTLLSSLYPLFGLISITWLVMLIYRRNAA